MSFDDWLAQPNTYLRDACDLLDEGAVVVNGEQLNIAGEMTLWVRLTVALLQQRSIESAAEVCAYLKRVLRRACAVLALAANGTAAEAADDEPRPPPGALLDASYIMELVLARREIYYYNVCAAYRPRRTAAERQASRAVISDADAQGSPPMLLELLQEFASIGGFGAVARALGTPAALRLQAAAMLLNTLRNVPHALSPTCPRPRTDFFLSRVLNV